MPTNPTPAATGTITGKVLANGTIKQGVVCYLDLRNSGKFEDDYPHSTSDSSGAIFFANLAPGQYKVRQLKDSLDANGLKQAAPDTSQWPMKAFDINVVAGQAAQVSFANVSINPLIPAPKPNPPSPTQPSTTITGMPFAFAINGGGVLDPAYDPQKHPEIIKACNDLGAVAMRLWCTGDLGKPVDPKMWDATNKYGAAGIGIIAVVNAQNYAGKNPSPQMMANHFNTWPSAANGMSVVEVFNEIDYEIGKGPYYTGSLEQYLTIMQVLYPILNAKGYFVIAANMIKNLSYLQNLLNDGLANCCDAVGVHAYVGTAAAAKPTYDTLANMARANKLSISNTEVGFHGASDWPGELAKLYKDNRARGGLYGHFGLLWSQKTKGAPGGIFDYDETKPGNAYKPNANYAALMAAKNS